MRGSQVGNSRRDAGHETNGHGEPAHPLPSPKVLVLRTGVAVGSGGVAVDGGGGGGGGGSGITVPASPSPQADKGRQDQMLHQDRKVATTHKGPSGR